MTHLGWFVDGNERYAAADRVKSDGFASHP